MSFGDQGCVQNPLSPCHHPPRLLLCLRRRGGNFFFKRQERSRKRKEEMEPGSVEQKKIRIRKSEMKSVKEGARV